MTFSAFELGRQDFGRGEPRGPGGDCAWGERVAGWDAAYRDSLEKATGGLRRVHAGRYESDDGMWSIVQTGSKRWTLLYGVAPGCRSQAEIMSFPTFREAMAALRAELPA